ncbi:MAG: hypothetical protein KGH60_03885 [Candidatus Micrarchaeota archaeon]|nr:hypothetical protein [Candidatus Micrarchaeota archaeon]
MAQQNLTVTISDEPFRVKKVVDGWNVLDTTIKEFLRRTPGEQDTNCMGAKQSVVCEKGGMIALAGGVQLAGGHKPRAFFAELLLPGNLGSFGTRFMVGHGDLEFNPNSFHVTGRNFGDGHHDPAKEMRCIVSGGRLKLAPKLMVNGARATIIASSSYIVFCGELSVPISRNGRLENPSNIY